MTRSLATRSLVAILVLVLPGLAALSSCRIGNCEAVELQRTGSPGGEFDALVFQKDCGALDTGSPFRVEIVKRGAGIGSGAEVATITTSRQCTSGQPAVSVQWDDRALGLTVTYPSDAAVSTKTRHKNILIRYRHCDARYPE